MSVVESPTPLIADGQASSKIERDKVEEKGERDSVKERRERSRWWEESLRQSPLAEDHGGHGGGASSLLKETRVR